MKPLKVDEDRKYGGVKTIALRYDSAGHRYWECICLSCGTIRKMRASSLLRGVKSCGCLHKARMKVGLCTIHGESSFRHGPGGTVEYRIWYGMIKRCYDTNADGYGHYGGRGISVCQQWRDSFKIFLADIGRRPGKEYSLDRIDNNGNYEPGNCRWTTQKQQMRNTRRCRMIDSGGKTQCTSAWAEDKGLHPDTLRARLGRGWDKDKALSVPTKRTLLTLDGETRSIGQWAKLSGVKANTIRERVRRGWSLRDAIFGGLRVNGW